MDAFRKFTHSTTTMRHSLIRKPQALTMTKGLDLVFGHIGSAEPSCAGALSVTLPHENDIAL